ncbi:MAG: 30S ribosomal protein S17 [Candidatus Pacearchaeota archaeon]
MKETEKQNKIKEKKNEKDNLIKIECNDKCCPKHGRISLRGRKFFGTVIKKFPKRVVIMFDRTVFVKKYERYSKRRTKLHARLPDCISKDIEIGDYIEIMETRPISKIIHFVVTNKIQSKEENLNNRGNEK